MMFQIILWLILHIDDGNCIKEVGKQHIKLDVYSFNSLSSSSSFFLSSPFQFTSGDFNSPPPIMERINRHSVRFRAPGQAYQPTWPNCFFTLFNETLHPIYCFSFFFFKYPWNIHLEGPSLGPKPSFNKFKSIGSPTECVLWPQQN